MDIYKVWSMSADHEESDFQIEFEARIAASDEEEALRTAREQLSQNDDSSVADAEQWDWMAVKLP